MFDWLEGPGPGLGLTRGWQCRPHSVAPQINLGSPACCGISMEIWPKHCRVETWRVAGVEWTGVTALESADPAFTENTPSSVGPLWWWARVSWSLQSSPQLRHDRTVRSPPGLSRSDWRHWRQWRHTRGKIWRQILARLRSRLDMTRPSENYFQLEQILHADHY